MTEHSKYITAIVLIFAFMISLSYSPLAFEGSGNQNCGTCHKLSKEEAMEILRKFDPYIFVEDIRMAPFKGMWEVVFQSRRRKELVYIDFSKENLIVGNIIRVKTRVNLTQDRIAELNKIDLSLIPLEDALVIGDKNAENRLIVFDDPD